MIKRHYFFERLEEFMKKDEVGIKSFLRAFLKTQRVDPP
jgi:hypothetical protein